MELLEESWDAISPTRVQASTLVYRSFSGSPHRASKKPASTSVSSIPSTLTLASGPAGKFPDKSDPASIKFDARADFT